MWVCQVLPCICVSLYSFSPLLLVYDIMLVGKHGATACTSQVQPCAASGCVCLLVALRFAMQCSSVGGWVTSDAVRQSGFGAQHGPFQNCADGRSSSDGCHSGGIPGHHVLHAIAVDAATSAGHGLRTVPEDAAWFTSDGMLDSWVLRHIVNPAARSFLSFVPVDERKHIIRVCMSRQHVLRSVDNYSQDCSEICCSSF